ncbi:hypothetical protein GCM10010403_14460 [Glycomyces rutgersensis]|uniref:Uncharacterized protein n=1 Tax=Glycomyces rutgersensis TaxID=58115 RepID=A0ABP5S9A8_9ACTN
MAAGGGLTGRDLAELTNLPEWEIEEQLKEVSSRTFANRSGRWRTTEMAYILCHEEIQQQATTMLGMSRLKAYKERIDIWASSYQTRRWPSETPEYLLRGYFSLLLANRDLNRLTSLAIDVERHERMLDIIGGDSVAISEVLSAQEVFLQDAPTDLETFCRLAVHRVSLMERNSHIPTHLPVVWAQLGKGNRGEALARSIIRPIQQVRALVSLSRELSDNGNNQDARAIVEAASQVATSIEDIPERVRCRAVVAQTMARIGDPTQARMILSQAEAAANSLTEGLEKSVAQSAIVRGLAANGELEHALSLAASVHDKGERAQAIGGVASEIANTGDWERAFEISKTIQYWSTRAPLLSSIGHVAKRSGSAARGNAIISSALNLAGRIRNPERRSWVLASIAHDLAQAGKRNQSHRVSQKALSALEVISGEHAKADSLIAIIRALAVSGFVSEATEIARSFNNLTRRSKALAVIASALAKQGKSERAEKLAMESESTARIANDRGRKDIDLVTLSQALGTVGDFVRAETTAKLIHDESKRDKAFTLLSEAIAISGDIETAQQTVDHISNHGKRLKALTRIVKSVASILDTSELDRLLDTIPDATVRNSLRRWISRNTGLQQADSAPSSNALTFSSAESRATEVDEVLELNSSKNDLFRIAREQTELAMEFLDDGDVASGLSAIGSIVIPTLRIDALLQISKKLEEHDQRSLSEDLVERAIQACASISNEAVRDRTRSKIARFLAENSDLLRGEELAYEVSSLPARQRTLATLSSIAGQLCRWAEAERIALSIHDSSLREKSLVSLVASLAEKGSFEEASRVAASIADPLARSSALREISLALADQGHSVHSEEVAARIPDSNIRARSFASIAPRASREHSSLLISKALSGGHWRLSIPTLVKVAPETVSVLANEFLLIMGTRNSGVG